jgi:hypothetical protein
LFHEKKIAFDAYFLTLQDRVKTLQADAHTLLSATKNTSVQTMFDAAEILKEEFTAVAKFPTSPFPNAPVALTLPASQGKDDSRTHAM